MGLLRTLCEIDISVILESDKIFKEFSGTLTEQFVLQELQATEITPTVYYWSEGATSEIDYIFSCKNMVIPVEAKAGLNVHAQSLRVFRDRYHPNLALRTSLKDFRNDDGLLNIPLYELWNLKNIIEKFSQ